LQVFADAGHDDHGQGVSKISTRLVVCGGQFNAPFKLNQ
jgi:hypothetical protein